MHDTLERAQAVRSSTQGDESRSRRKRLGVTAFARKRTEASRAVATS